MRVLIVGGGIMGLSVAVEAARVGLEATVLERAIPGAEASSAAAGMLAPQLEAHAPDRFLELCLRARGLYPVWAKGLEALAGIEVGYRESGALKLAFTEAEAHALSATVDWHRAASLRAALLTGDEARALEPRLSPKVLAAAHFPDDHQVDPPKLMRALQLAAHALRVEVRSGTVRQLLDDGRRVTGVDLDGAALEADAVVLAAGSWSALVPGAALEAEQVKPARGQMLELQARLPQFHHILSGAGGYCVPRADGRVACGSTLEFVGYDKDITAAGQHQILEGALRLCPALGAATVQRSWAGLRPWTPDQLPLLGEGPRPGLLLATGHFRNGILLAPITGRLLGQLLRGEQPSMDLTPFRAGRAFPQAPAGTMR